ncbi:MAG: hypothetical protein AB4372_10910 [Xenococcus sp. (in: cyanobacteria)]
MSDNNPVLSIVFVTGEDIEASGLPVLKVNRGKNKYTLLEGEEVIESVLIESLNHLNEESYILLSMRVEIALTSDG